MLSGDHSHRSSGLTGCGGMAWDVVLIAWLGGF